MKARPTKTTTWASLSPQVRAAATVVVQELAEKKWQEVRHDVSNRFLCSMALALNDLYGFGAVRIQRVMEAMGEIATGYSDETYTPAERRNGTKELGRMADKMLDELKARGIDIELK